MTQQNMGFKFPDWTSYAQPGPVQQQPFTLPSYSPQPPVAPGVPGNDFSGMQKWFGGRNAEGATTAGIIPAGLGAVSGIANIGLGLANLKDARAASEEAKENWAMNWNAQANLTNTELADRQRARIAASGGGYDVMSVDDYMAQHGIKEKKD